MRRREKELVEQQQLEDILRQGRELQLAMHDGDYPYVLPLNYGYADGYLYFHCALEGKKLDCLRSNPKVGFCISEVLKRIEGDAACKWSTLFRSVVGRGTAEIIETREGKIAGYNVIMQHFDGPVGNYAERLLKGSVLVRIKIDSMTGKQSQ